MFGRGSKNDHCGPSNSKSSQGTDFSMPTRECDLGTKTGAFCQARMRGCHEVNNRVIENARPNSPPHIRAIVPGG